MTLRIVCLAALLFAAACGDSSPGPGIEGTKLIGELSNSEIREFCQYALDRDREHAGSECRPEATPEEDLDECVAEIEQFSSSCRVTVDQGTDCLEAQTDHPCDEDPHECEVFAGC